MKQLPSLSPEEDTHLPSPCVTSFMKQGFDCWSGNYLSFETDALSNFTPFFSPSPRFFSFLKGI